MLADAAGEGGGAVAIEVGLQAVADGFVEQNAGPAGTEHDGHFPGRRFDRVELDERLAGGFAGEVLRRFRSRKMFEADAPAAAGVAFFGLAAVVAGKDGDAHAGHGLAIPGEAAVTGGDKDVAQAVGVGGGDPEDARIGGAAGLVGAADEGDAVGQSAVGGRDLDGVEIASEALHQPSFQNLGGTGGDTGCVAAARRIRSGARLSV